MAGRITWFDLQLDAEGKTKGMAIVQYSHPIEAVQAISMLNNQRLLDRVLSVKMDRFEKDVDRNSGDALPVGLRAIGMGLGANGAPLSDVQSVLTSLASVNGASMASMPMPQTPVQAFVPQPQQPPMNGNSYGTPQSAFSQTPGLHTPSANLNGSYGSNSMGMGSASVEGPLGPYNSLPQQQPDYKPGYFNTTQQPVNNGPPMNSSGFNSNPRDMYTKMSPQMNYGHQQQQQQQSQPINSYYDGQPSRVILIKNVSLLYIFFGIFDILN